MNKFVSALILASLLGVCGCDKPEEVPVPKPSEPAPSPSASGNPLLAPVDYVGTAVRVKQAATRTVDTAGLNQAIQLFNVQEGRFPKDLNELVEQKYIARIPEPQRGMRLEYDAAKGQARMVRVQ